MKGILHYIEDDLNAIESCYGWACWDIVDEHWMWLWEGIIG